MKYNCIEINHCIVITKLAFFKETKHSEVPLASRSTVASVTLYFYIPTCLPRNLPFSTA